MKRLAVIIGRSSFVVGTAMFVGAATERVAGWIHPISAEVAGCVWAVTSALVLVATMFTIMYDTP